MSVQLTKESLALVGVELLESGPVIRLRCMACGLIYMPNRQMIYTMPGAWWKCPKDPAHTKD